MITKYRIYLENSIGIGDEFEIGDIVSTGYNVGEITYVGMNYVQVLALSGNYRQYTIGYIKPATPEEIEEYKLVKDANKYNL